MTSSHDTGIPAGLDVRRSPDESGGGGGGARPPRILLVDDNEQNLELLEAYLEELGAEVSTACDGVEALDVIARGHPDLILLDIMMPRMSGYQLCGKLKGDAKTRHIPVIMVTALAEVSDMERATDCGADDFLTKPVHKPDLLAKVRAKLGAAR
ncbi:MAG: response regulator [Phycisphaerae bacterium]|nr:response regulator [Phycisphaerae bacterium]